METPSSLAFLPSSLVAMFLLVVYCLQSTMREEFRDCTVLCIAHRLHTIIYYDRCVFVVALCGPVASLAPAMNVLRKDEVVNNTEGLPSELSFSVNRRFGGLMVDIVTCGSVRWTRVRHHEKN